MRFFYNFSMSVWLFIVNYLKLLVSFEIMSERVSLLFVNSIYLYFFLKKIHGQSLTFGGTY